MVFFGAWELRARQGRNRDDGRHVRTAGTFWRPTSKQVAYGREEPVTDLIPAMLTSFLESDRTFARAREDARKGPP